MNSIQQCAGTAFDLEHANDNAQSPSPEFEAAWERGQELCRRWWQTYNDLTGGNGHVG